jgi:hypothetical protein
MNTRGMQRANAADSFGRASNGPARFEMPAQAGTTALGVGPLALLGASMNYSPQPEAHLILEID